LVRRRYSGGDHEKDRAFEQAKKDLLRRIEWDKFVASVSPEASEEKNQQADDLIGRGIEKAQQGAYREAIDIFREAYELDSGEDIRQLLLDTYRGYAEGLLSVENWQLVIVTLDPLKKEGLLTGAVYYLLAAANIQAFLLEDRIPSRYLRKAVEEAEGAIEYEPLNPLFLLQLANAHAHYAQWWRSAQDGAEHMRNHHQEVSRLVGVASTVGIEEQEVRQKLREVITTLEQSASLSEVFQPSTLDFIDTLRR